MIIQGYSNSDHIAKNLLGWSPTIALREGLARTISYFEERLRRSQA